MNIDTQEVIKIVNKTKKVGTEKTGHTLTHEVIGLVCDYIIKQIELYEEEEGLNISLQRGIK